MVFGGIDFARDYNDVCSVELADFPAGETQNAEAGAEAGDAKEAGAA